MNIEEARKVLWLKSDPRPLGELLDEGYLTKDRLEWAAAWAYNLKLKQAAQIMLEYINQLPSEAAKHEAPKPDAKETSAAIEIPISLEKAWSTLWPFAPYKGQRMGELAEARQLSLKDLGFAIENAWDEKVRRAAIALALVRLNQVVQEPTPSAGFVHVVSGGRSYSERRESRLILLQGMVLGWTIILLLGMVWLLLSGALSPKPSGVPITEIVTSPAQWVTVIVAFGLMLLGGWLIASIPEQITKRLDKQIEDYRLGQEGEDNVVQLIVQALDGSWHVFRNVVIPGRNKADLDLVLVGPPGVWALEVKNFRGEFRNQGETWEYMRGKTWKAASKNPSRQANNNSLRLKNFLKADGINAFVNSAIIWANSEGKLAIENPTVTVWQYSRLADELGNIWQGEKLSEPERNKIIEKLTKLCNNQRKHQQELKNG